MSGCRVYAQAMRVMCKDHDYGEPRTWKEYSHNRSSSYIMFDFYQRHEGDEHRLPDHLHTHHPIDHEKRVLKRGEPSYAVELQKCDGRFCGTLWTCFKTPALLEKDDLKKTSLEKETLSALERFDLLFNKKEKSTKFYRRVDGKLVMRKVVETKHSSLHWFKRWKKDVSKRTRPVRVMKWWHLIRTSIWRLGKRVIPLSYWRFLPNRNRSG